LDEVFTEVAFQRRRIALEQVGGLGLFALTRVKPRTQEAEQGAHKMEVVVTDLPYGIFGVREGGAYLSKFLFNYVLVADHRCGVTVGETGLDRGHEPLGGWRVHHALRALGDVTDESPKVGAECPRSFSLGVQGPVLDSISRRLPKPRCRGDQIVSHIRSLQSVLQPMIEQSA